MVVDRPAVGSRLPGPRGEVVGLEIGRRRYAGVSVQHPLHVIVEGEDQGIGIDGMKPLRLTVEEVKRYTGLGTGPCQGKECMLPCALLCARAGAPVVEPFTSRPPVAPIALGVLARAGEDES